MGLPVTKLPAHEVPEQMILNGDGTMVCVRVLEPNRYGRRNHRVQYKCDCGQWIPASRSHQHKCKV